MHLWIILAALALAAVTPYIGAPSASDSTQISDDAGDLDQAADEDDEQPS